MNTSIQPWTFFRLFSSENLINSSPSISLNELIFNPYLTSYLAKLGGELKLSCVEILDFALIQWTENLDLMRFLDRVAVSSAAAMLTSWRGM